MSNLRFLASRRTRSVILVALLAICETAVAYVPVSAPARVGRVPLRLPRYGDVGLSRLSVASDSNNDVDDGGSSGRWSRQASTVSQTAAVKASSSLDAWSSSRADRYKMQLTTLIRVGLPSVLAGVGAFFAFPWLALTLASMVNDAGVFAVLSQDSSQFVQNFLTVTGLLFSILVGQTYYFMYQQQEMVYYALFAEVTEAKSLLEQVALVCQGRSMYANVLNSISRYVKEDLKQLQADPAALLSARPVDDPLEAVMYLTSVGVPGTVYETVRSLRQARAQRLGALQRKLPAVHMLLLWVLAVLELVSFPLLGAGTQTIGGYNILTVEGCLFGVMTVGIVMTLRVVGELWRPAGGAYNVDGVLSVMVRGLEEELRARTSGTIFAEGGRYPTVDAATADSSYLSTNKANDLPLLRQGAPPVVDELASLALAPVRKALRRLKRRTNDDDGAEES